MRDVVISIMATLAEQERISISERTKAGLARAKRSGKVLGIAIQGGHGRGEGKAKVWPEPARHRSGPRRQSGFAGEENQDEMTRVQTGDPMMR
jgi:DNA invertase Pin-like site-specific DNA recombinase